MNISEEGSVYEVDSDSGSDFVPGAASVCLISVVSGRLRDNPFRDPPGKSSTDRVGRVETEGKGRWQ